MDKSYIKYVKYVKYVFGWFSQNNAYISIKFCYQLTYQLTNYIYIYIYIFSISSSTYHLYHTYAYVYISFKKPGAGILVGLERHVESINSPHARRVVTRARMRSSWLWETTIDDEKRDRRVLYGRTDGGREAATILSVRPRSNQLKARGSTVIYAGKINKSDVSLPALGRLLASLLSFLPRQPGILN